MERIYTLIQRAQEGDKEAKEAIIKENSGLIWSVVRRFQGRAEQEDLYQIGTIGLLKCIEKFDFTYEVKFSTYAVPMIVGEIKRFLRDDGTIKVSRKLKELSYQVKQLQDQIQKEENRELTVSELAKMLSIEKEEIHLALECTKEVESLYSFQGNDSKALLQIDRISNHSANEKMMDQIYLKEAIQHLGKKERQIIIMRYYQDRTQTEIAKKLGISQVQVSRIEKKVLKQMKESLQ